MSNVKYAKLSESSTGSVEDDSSFCPASSGSGTSMIELSLSGRNLRENHYREKSRESTEMSAGGMESERC